MWLKGKESSSPLQGNYLRESNYRFFRQGENYLFKLENKKLLLAKEDWRNLMVQDARFIRIYPNTFPSQVLEAPLVPELYIRDPNRYMIQKDDTLIWFVEISNIRLYEISISIMAVIGFWTLS